MGDLGATYDDDLRLIRKRIVDFLLVKITANDQNSLDLFCRQMTAILYSFFVCEVVSVTQLLSDVELLMQSTRNTVIK